MSTGNLASGHDAERQPLLEPSPGLAPQAGQHEAVHSSENPKPGDGKVSLVIKFTLALTGENFRFDGVSERTYRV